MTPAGAKSGATLLALDIGNTSMTAGLFRGDRLVRRGRLDTGEALRCGDLASRLAACVRLERLVPDGAIFANVSLLEIGRRLARSLGSRFGCPVVAVTPASPLGLPLDVKAPREVGADRIVNALAARELFGGPAAVVDIGTATTVDCVSADGAYLGGAIMPGPGTAAESLTRRTARLPLVEPARALKAIGKDTVECIRSGLYFGHLGMIRGMLDRTLGEMKAAGRASVVVTGGYARLFERDLPSGWNVLPDLTLHGLRMAYDIMERDGRGLEGLRRAPAGEVRR
ncbi:MAG: type III pantothenate kinase [Elusimicrobia bacterium]|nr:type III pantothenate kinase [Elusimicrobiota bacterium]